MKLRQMFVKIYFALITTLLLMGCAESNSQENLTDEDARELFEKYDIAYTPAPELQNDIEFNTKDELENFLIEMKSLQQDENNKMETFINSDQHKMDQELIQFQILRDTSSSEISENFIEQFYVDFDKKWGTTYAIDPTKRPKMGYNKDIYLKNENE